MLEQRRDYYVPREMASATWTLAVVAALCGVVGLFLIPAPGARTGLGIFFFLLAAVIAVQAAATPGIRLELSEEGLCYRHIGYKMCTNWPNVVGRAQERTGKGVVEVLALREPAEVIAWRPWLSGIVRILVLPGKKARFIPLSPFLYANPQLLEDLERFLPTPAASEKA